ncbi:hypothetical protein ES708_32523 [subsurface metagenome]
MLLANYTGYDVAWPLFSSQEERVYQETIDYLEGARAKKVYATSPSFQAMSTEFESPLAFDTFALLWLEEKTPEEIVDNLVSEGVDYIVIDTWAKKWGPPFANEIAALINEIRHRSRLMIIIAPSSSCPAEIYLLGADKGSLFNGDFTNWVAGEEINLPLGWQSRVFTGEGDELDIGRATVGGIECLKVSLFEDGLREENLDYSFAAVVQRDVPFPDGLVSLQLFTEADTIKSGSTILGPAIHLTDRDGHALIIGFSSEIEEDITYTYEDGDRMLVILKMPQTGWSEITLDLASYWSQAGWLVPQEVDIFLAVAATYNMAGYQTLYIAGIEWGTPNQ